MNEQGLKEQQAAQGKGAAGAVHGNRLTSEGRADPPGDPISAHYEISGAILTKSLLDFLLRGNGGGHLLGKYVRKKLENYRQSLTLVSASTVSYHRARLSRHPLLPAAFSGPHLTDLTVATLLVRG
jgi:hypothetical protein